MAPAAAAEPMATSRFRDAPGAWVAPSGTLTVSAGSDAIRLAPAVHAGLGLGGIADIEVGYRGDLQACERCDDEDDDSRRVQLLTSRFRLGGDLEPVVRLPLHGAVAFERSFAARPSGDAAREPAFAALSGALGIRTPSLILGGGVSLWAGGDEVAPEMAMLDVERARPFGLVGWRPRDSKTLLLGEFAYQPAFLAAKMRADWVAGGGVRYLAFPWGASELMVRGRTQERAFLMISVRFHARTKVW